MSKKQPRLMEWIDPEARPSIDGVYQRNYNNGFGADNPVYAKYKHGQWFVYGRTPAHAERMDCPSDNKAPWRGLAVKP